MKYISRVWHPTCIRLKNTKGKTDLIEIIQKDKKNGLQPILQWENVKTTGILYDSLYDSVIQNKRLTSYGIPYDSEIM